MPAFEQQQSRTQSSLLASPARPDRANFQPALIENSLISQQQAFGNRAMQRLVRSKVIQAKFTINEPGDQYEQEADRVADAVMRMPDPGTTDQAAVGRQAPGIQRRCSECEEELHRQPMEEEGAALGRIQPPRIQRVCSECEEELHRQPVEEEEEGETLQAKEVSGQTPEVTPDVQAEINAMQGRGRPLPESVRAFFEPRLGHDFSQVRIHTGGRAVESARAINALAYTVGRDVVFGAGQYAPGTAEGKKLLAHELTHTVQQMGAGGAARDRPTRLQRTIGDGHDLTAARFAGDVILEAVYDNERLLQVGNRGPAVVKLQQALIDAGFPLPQFGADGIFGAETKAAVEGFQRASGLAGGDIRRGFDGIVGPTTMGWLDQRFSAGPTPPGTTLRATPGCPTIKTVNVDLVSLDGSTRDALQELDRATSIFNQCCVKFAQTGGGSLGDARTRDLLGGDNVLHVNPRCGNPTMEEIRMFNGAAADFNLSGRIRAFYVGSITPRSTPMGDTDAYSVPPFCATGFGAALRNMAVITNTASERGLAHEFGHLLRNDSVHWDDDSTALMSPAEGNPPGERLTPNDCATIFPNA